MNWNRVLLVLWFNKNCADMAPNHPPIKPTNRRLFSRYLHLSGICESHLSCMYIPNDIKLMHKYHGVFNVASQVWYSEDTKYIVSKKSMRKSIFILRFIITNNVISALSWEWTSTKMLTRVLRISGSKSLVEFGKQWPNVIFYCPILIPLEQLQQHYQCT